MRLKLGQTADGFGVVNDGSPEVIEEIRRDAPMVAPPARGRSANAKLPRLRYQRVFLQWFEHARGRLLVPIHIVPIRKDGIRFEVAGFSGCLHGTVKNDGISVRVHRQGEMIDYVWDNDCLVKRVREGFYCGLVMPEFSAFYPTREALWIDHMFEPFLEWMNDVPAKAEVLRLSIGSWGSCAEFLSADGKRVRRCQEVVETQPV